MTRADGLTAINCTNCGAGLDVLGGGRVTTHICPYCGSELDAQHDYAVLKTFANAERPDSPFRIGMTGQLYGVDWTVIGTLGHEERWAGKIWRWVDHQLYSPTHGYAWLTVEDGHVTFSRRFRGLVRPAWMGETWVETAEHPPTVMCRGERYVYLQTSKSQITFAEGEFTWSPEIGQSSTTISAMSRAHMLDFSQTGTEREIYRSSYVFAADALAAFGLPHDALRPVGVHPLEPYIPGPHSVFLRKTAILAAMVCLLIGAIFHLMPGRAALEPTQFQFAELPQSVSIPIDDTARLAGLYMESDVSNSWAYVPLEVTAPDGTNLFETGRTLEYYFGREDNESWREGNRRDSLFFRPTVAGDYQVTLHPPETGAWGTQSRLPSQVTLWARSGLSSGFWMWGLALGFGLVALWHYGRAFVHKKRRWAHGDWSEE
ncbi:DUF4178 domain-containing protein [Lutimaribacter sp. EGI FJ00015]|uniref:DUF4178 domain-containing protein n=1 Tax=Lutimaribacter degradans TaxID=2945989 RepID=A0ACC5ZZ85_9RHOB|nr:DUF4178 domain-containing protein [Lutimaribacter sp. EGI FJ00013]MCM2563238.1 DUF4178 domain-containing protein [Lutimaribacter sp. EGI FJ00013]MCO0614439.1 DUF4178 domain-containing protein [Lutimaribacter sp. EGI FJ00015]MCO0635960.1 DUF4178 domain-containing protein [Lutimaribacter sp. EGI FJ00014]